MTLPNRERADAYRIVELNAVLEPLGDRASRELPEAWNERAALVRAQNERDRLEEKERKEREAKNRAARFQPTIEAFRARAQTIGKAFESKAVTMGESLAGMNALRDEYNALWRDGMAAGAKVPVLDELSGVGTRRLQRVEIAIHLLALGDE